MLPWNPPSAFSLAGNGNGPRDVGSSGSGYSPYADSQMSQQQHQQQTQQLQHQQQQQQQHQQQQQSAQAGPSHNGTTGLGGGAGGAGGNGSVTGQNPGGGPPLPAQNQAYPPMTLASTLHFLQSEHRRYARDRNEWEIERAEMRARIALLEGEKRGNEGALKSLARRCKMLEMALRGERSKFLTSTGGGGPGAATGSAAAPSSGAAASPAVSGTSSPVPAAVPTLAPHPAPPSAKSPNMQQQEGSGASAAEPPKSIPMSSSTSSPGQAAGSSAPGQPSQLSAAHGRTESVPGGAANGFASGTWASTGAGAAGSIAASSAAAGGLRDPRGKARSREYLKQCLQEITYLTSSATLNPLATHSYAAPGVPRPRKVLPEQIPVSSAPGVLNLGPGGGPATATTATTAAAMVSAATVAPGSVPVSVVPVAATVAGAQPGAEFEPVAASAIAASSSSAAASAAPAGGLATATPVAFPPVAAAPSASEADHFGSAPAATPTPLTNGLASADAAPNEAGTATSEVAPAADLDAQESAEDAADVDEEDQSAASDPPSAFVPLKRQVSRPGQSGRGGGGGSRAKGKGAAEREHGGSGDADEMDRAIAELASEEAKTQAAAKAQAAAADASDLGRQGEPDATSKDFADPTVEAPDAPEEVEQEAAPAETSTVTEVAAGDLSAPSDKDSDYAGAREEEKPREKFFQVQNGIAGGNGDIGTLSRGQAGRGGIAGLFDQLGDGSERRGGEAGLSSFPPREGEAGSDRTGADAGAAGVPENEGEEVSTALFRPEEGWRQKLAAAGRRAYPRAGLVAQGGDDELAALEWDGDDISDEVDDDEVRDRRGRKHKKQADGANGAERGDKTSRFKALRVLRSHLDAVRLVRVVDLERRDGHRGGIDLVTGSDDCTVKVWRDVVSDQSKELEPVATLRGHAGPITALAIATGLGSDTGRVILSGSLDSTICLWRYPAASHSAYDPVDDSVLLGTIETKSDAVWGIEHLSANQFVCITADGSTQLWKWDGDAQAAALAKTWIYRAANPKTSRGSLSQKPTAVQVPTALTLWRPPQEMQGVEPVHQNALVVVAYQDGLVRFYDATSQSDEPVHVIRNDDSAAGPLEKQINALAVDPSGRYLLAGREDRMVSVYSLPPSERPLYSFAAHQDGVTSSAFLSADRFVTGSHDTSLRLWSLEIGAKDGDDDGPAVVVQCLQDLQAHRVQGAEGVLDVAVSMTNAEASTEREAVLVSAGADGTIRVWMEQ